MQALEMRHFWQLRSDMQSDQISSKGPDESGTKHVEKTIVSAHGKKHTWKMQDNLKKPCTQNNMINID